MSSSALDDPMRCQWCGNFHKFKCPMVKSMEYQEGSCLLKKVEFFAPNDFPKIDLKHGPGEVAAAILDAAR